VSELYTEWRDDFKYNANKRKVVRYMRTISWGHKLTKFVWMLLSYCWCCYYRLSIVDLLKLVIVLANCAHPTILRQDGFLKRLSFQRRQHIVADYSNMSSALRLKNLLLIIRWLCGTNSVMVWLFRACSFGDPHTCNIGYTCSQVTSLKNSQ